MKKENKTTFDRIGNAIDEMSDNQMTELLSCAERILSKGNEKKGSESLEGITEETAGAVPVPELTSEGIVEIMALTGAERKAMAKYLSMDNETLSQKLSERSLRELEENSKQNSLKAALIENNPTVIWAAHVFYNMRNLIVDLEQITDAARENLSESAEGQYKMFLQAVENSVDKMVKLTMRDNDHEEILYMITQKTDDPTK